MAHNIHTYTVTHTQNIYDTQYTTELQNNAYRVCVIVL